MTAPDTAGIEAALADVLAAALHAAVCGNPDVCCWTEEGGTCAENSPLGIEAHVAAALLPVVTQAQAEALREAADEIAAWRRMHERWIASGLANPDGEVRARVRVISYGRAEQMVRARADESGA